MKADSCRQHAFGKTSLRRKTGHRMLDDKKCWRVSFPNIEKGQLEVYFLIGFSLLLFQKGISDKHTLDTLR